jgi:uncharacterized protein YjbI with pentapeptide repeats
MRLTPWIQWKTDNQGRLPDLSGGDLSDLGLSGIDLSEADLSRAVLK